MELEITTYSPYFRAYGLSFERGVKCRICGRWGVSVSFYKWSITFFPFGRGNAAGCTK